MLGQRGLADADPADERPDIGFLPLHQDAEDLQAPLIGEGAQDIGDFQRFGFESRGIDRFKTRVHWPSLI